MKSILNTLDEIIESRKTQDEHEYPSYVNKLYNKGIDAILKKIAEESGEVIMASKDTSHTSQNVDKITYEVADLWFHSLILLNYHGLSSDDVLAELQRREGKSGIIEKLERKDK
ncbi:MAG: hypothetical protein RLZZ210_1621 [Pseudomonadota bacterium]|jgi:phosphoribosyl-ATP pyrophosphohydrolase